MKCVCVKSPLLRFNVITGMSSCEVDLRNAFYRFVFIFKYSAKTYDSFEGGITYYSPPSKTANCVCKYYFIILFVNTSF